MSQRSRGNNSRIRSNVRAERSTVVAGPASPPEEISSSLSTPTPGPFVVSLEGSGVSADTIGVAAADPAAKADGLPLSERPTLPEPEPVDRDHESFFDGGARPAEVAHEDHAPPDPKLVLKMRPDVRARRAKLTQYVQWTVGSLVVVCVVALGKLVAARGANHVGSFTHASHESQVAMADIKSVMPIMPVTLVDTPKPPAEPAEPAESAESPVVAAPAPDPKAAAEQKRDARIALERGAFARAVDAGERSVALDAKDGEAWLLLGAAYQSLGKSADARRCFVACTREGTRGPLGECRAMLR